MVIVRLVEAKRGRNRNWVVFSGYVPRLDNSRLFTFEFCGTELHTSASLPEADKEAICDKMGDLFGFPPFDTREIKEMTGVPGGIEISID